ncbi:MAG: hypothetical protein KJ704_07095 [Proteobacteria bacterium]|nr:hypothetical protein [Pseudomonadota bacterium]
MDKVIDIPTTAEVEEFLPIYSSEGASGADVRAHIEKPMVLSPGCSALVPTGLRVAIPKGYEIQVRPRSGLAFKHQITVLNTPGTIDADLLFTPRPFAARTFTRWERSLIFLIPYSVGDR